MRAILTLCDETATGELVGTRTLDFLAGETEVSFVRLLPLVGG